MIRGQAYTLEGVIAGLILISAVLFGLQAVDTAPYSGGTNQRSTAMLHQELQDAMAIARDDGSFRRAVSCIDASGNPDSRPASVQSDNVTTPGTVLDTAFDEVGYSYNVYYRYWENTTSSPTGNARQNESVVFDSGPPTSDAVTSTQRVTLYNDTTVRTWNEDAEACTPAPETVQTHSSFYAPYVGAGTDLYTVVEVYVVVWRRG